MRSQGQVDALFSKNKAFQLRLPKASKNNQNEVRHFNRHDVLDVLKDAFKPTA